MSNRDGGPEIVRAALVQTKWTGDKQSMIEANVALAREQRRRAPRSCASKSCSTDPTSARSRTPSTSPTPRPCLVPRPR